MAMRVKAGSQATRITHHVPLPITVAWVSSVVESSTKVTGIRISRRWVLQFPYNIVLPQKRTEP